jgi:predicted nucleic acid-binding Zn ribbon protein
MKHDDPNPRCDVCMGQTKRLIAGGTDFILTGTGWYGKNRVNRIGSKPGKNVKRFK